MCSWLSRQITLQFQVADFFVKASASVANLPFCTFWASSLNWTWKWARGNCTFSDFRGAAAAAEIGKDLYLLAPRVIEVDGADDVC